MSTRTSVDFYAILIDGSYANGKVKNEMITK